jgi:hypothetical protein
MAADADSEGMGVKVRFPWQSLTRIHSHGCAMASNRQSFVFVCVGCVIVVLLCKCQDIKFPAKTWTIASSSTVEIRRDGLQQWLNKLLGLNNALITSGHYELDEWLVGTCSQFAALAGCLACSVRI